MSTPVNLLVDVIPFKALVVESRHTPGIYEVEGIMQRAGSENQNGRVYRKELLVREVEKFRKTFINNGNAYGELDHPDSPIVSLKNASHIIKDLWWEGEELRGRLELLDTPSGNIVRNILKAGHTIGISSRGTGSVQQTNEGTLLVQSDFDLVTWDFVSNPSTVGAFMKAVSLSEGKLPVDKYSRVSTIINDILRH